MLAHSVRRAVRLPALASAQRLFSTSPAARPEEPQASDIFNPTPEHGALRDMVRSFVTSEVEPQALEYNREERFNKALFQRAGELGLLGVTVDPEYDGAGMDATAACIVHEELSAADPAFCLSYLAHSQLFVNNLARNGSPEQCARWLPAACRGDKIGGMGMSEPGTGTDVLAMRTTAKKAEDGGYIINGSKMWITNGCTSDSDLGDIYLVYARTGGPEVKASKAVSLFILEKGMPGFSLGQRIKDKCGMRASPTAEIVFEDVHVSRHRRDTSSDPPRSRRRPATARGSCSPALVDAASGLPRPAPNHTDPARSPYDPSVAHTGLAPTPSKGSRGQSDRR